MQKRVSFLAATGSKGGAPAACTKPAVVTLHCKSFWAGKRAAETAAGTQHAHHVKSICFAAGNIPAFAGQTLVRIFHYCFAAPAPLARVGCVPQSTRLLSEAATEGFRSMLVRMSVTRWMHTPSALMLA